MSDDGDGRAARGARVLELGCGFNKTPGAFGVDIIAGSSADLIHDLDVFPYPLADSAWDRIICRDVLEHVADFVRTMEEIWRVGSSRSHGRSQRSLHEQRQLLLGSDTSTRLYVAQLRLLHSMERPHSGSDTRRHASK